MALLTKFAVHRGEKTVYRPIRALVNMKDLPMSGGSDSVGCWTVWVDDQRVVLFLVGRKDDFNKVWVRHRVFWDELL